MPDANPEILRLLLEDQWDRGVDMFGAGQVRAPETLDWKAIEARDTARQLSAHRLLAAGGLKSGTDFWFAALVFQHSSSPTDLMLAHVLAATAVAKGNRNAKWLSAATLDRYLHRTRQPQVFGTQFETGPDGRWTMEPYSTVTLSDAERALWCVVPLAEQQRILEDVRRGKPLAPTTTGDCQ